MGEDNERDDWDEDEDLDLYSGASDVWFGIVAAIITIVLVYSFAKFALMIVG